MESYGPVEVGLSGCKEYLTPFQTTIVYDPNSLLQSTIALLLQRAQMVPMKGDFKSMVASCEHPSPAALIFAPATLDDAMEFFTREFQRVYIFGGEIAGADERVTVLKPDDIYELDFAHGALAPYILDHLLVMEYPDYKSMCDGVNTTSGKNLLRVLNWSPDPLRIITDIIAAGYRGYDKLNEYVVRGAMCGDLLNNLSVQEITNGILVDVDFVPVWFVRAILPAKQMLESVPEGDPVNLFASVRLVVFYQMEVHAVENIHIPGWKITASTKGIKDGQDAKEFLSRFASDAIGDNSLAVAWVPTGSADVILPFIYPGKNKTD